MLLRLSNFVENIFQNGDNRMGLVIKIRVFRIHRQKLKRPLLTK